MKLSNTISDFNQAEAIKFFQTTPDIELFKQAKALRELHHGKQINTCMIMNAKSGHCSEDCKWCSQSKYHSSKIDIYGLVAKDEVLKRAELAQQKQVKRFSLVTSGRKLDKNAVIEAASYYAEANTKHPNVKYCASMGLLNKEELKELYNAGVTRYHCNIETAPSYFPKLCSTHTQAEKVKTIQWARQVGMDICSGGIIGLGETEEQRIEMAIYLRDLQIKSIPINILIPIKGTAMENTPKLSKREILRAFAIFRIINPDADIRIAGGRVCIESFEDEAFNTGISASMVGNLLTTAGPAIDKDIKHLKSLGYKL